MTVRVVIGADHGGFALKSELVPWLKAQGYEVLDLGAARYEAGDDYPDFAEAVAKSVASGQAQRGIIICGSGVGACIAANKIKGVRAGLCH
jgi:ribose 5-phosphate isomerase B